jgi:hypothetical protein
LNFSVPIANPAHAFKLASNTYRKTEQHEFGGGVFMEK